MKKIDFVERLNFLLETLYYDAFASGNRLVFEYDASYPRIYAIDGHNILKAMEWLTKAFLTSVKNTTININFKLTNYNINTIFFDVLFKAQEENSIFNENCIQKAREFATAGDAKILILNKKEIILSIKAMLDRSMNVVNFRLKSPEIKSWHVVVGHKDSTCFRILIDILKTIGVKIIAKSDFDTFRNHVKDSIYMPSVVFVSMDYFKNEKDLLELLEFQKIKKYNIVAVCHEEIVLDERLQDNVIIIREPYTYDSIVAALNACYIKDTKK